ncbi:MAG TPA: hypothetical protein VGC45_14850 [Gryllotalpicola sp.]
MTERMPRLLLVEDDARLAPIMTEYLTGGTVRVERTGPSGTVLVLELPAA